MTAFRFDRILTTDGWFSPGYVSVDELGLIRHLSRLPPRDSVEVIGGIAIPGLANVHSHAFQRAMAGLSEFRTSAAADSFWTWRDLMYRFVARITPDDLEAIAAQLYVEMLKAGYTSVGEFQYLHHDRDGTEYSEPAEMSLRTVAAALRTGIAVTVLPVLYQNSDFGGAPPNDGQRRFVTRTERFLRIVHKLQDTCGTAQDCRVGVAPHSLRAVGAGAIRHMSDSVDPDTPVHIHIAEQEKEVQNCRLWSGRRPVEWLLENIAVDRRWCLVHATHMTEGETRLAAQTGATAGLCPTTEANLGDGLFPLRAWLDAGGRFGIGSDSHVSISPVEELRWLEYGQRLLHRQRNIAGDEHTSTGMRLYAGAVEGGARCLKFGNGLIQKGARADIVVLDGDSPLFAGRKPETILDSWIFSGNRPTVTDVFVGGRRVIVNQRHDDEEAIAATYRETLQRLLAD